jgi:endonuclease/exonuclease/phosphatase family metal-dependent hydrolase
MPHLCTTCILWLCLQCTLVWAQPYDPAPASLRVMSWNVEWMFDDNPSDNLSELAREQSAPSSAHWQAKLGRVAEVIAAAKPDIVALQEIEGRQTLTALSEQLRTAHRRTYRHAFIEGNDSFTEQDVGLLYRSGLIAFRRHEQSKAMFESQQYYHVSKHLVCEFRWKDIASPLTIMNVHLRATPEAEDLRVRQARLLRQWMSLELAAGQDVIILGDFNSEYFARPASGTSEPAGEVAILLGHKDQPSLSDLLGHVTGSHLSTHVILEKQFDRIFASQSLMEDGPGKDWTFEKLEIITAGVIRGQRDGAEHWSKRLSESQEDLKEIDVSDHFPVVATFRAQ